MTSVRENIKRIIDERASAWETTGKPLADIASTRELTADEKTLAEAAERAFDDFEDRLEVLYRQAEQERRLAEFSEQLRDPNVREALANEIRSVLRGDVKSANLAPTIDEVRALGTTSPAAGGNVVGQSFLAQLLEPLRQFSGVVAAGAYQFVTASGESITVPRLNSFGAAVPVVQATQIGGTDPTFNQVTFGAHKYGEYTGIANELVTDALIDIEGFVARILGENIAILAGQKYAVGTGTAEPTGVAVAATVGVTGATGVGGAPSWDNLIDLQESLAAPYQPRGAWLAANSAVAAVRKMKDASGRYLWEPGGQVGAPNQLLGSPVHRDPFVSAVGLGARSLLFGDFSRYWIRVVGAVKIERSDHALFGSDQTAVRGILRTDGQLVDAGAVKTFVGGAS